MLLSQTCGEELRPGISTTSGPRPITCTAMRSLENAAAWAPGITASPCGAGGGAVAHAAAAAMAVRPITKPRMLPIVAPALNLSITTLRYKVLFVNYCRKASTSSANRSGWSSMMKWRASDTRTSFAVFTPA